LIFTRRTATNDPKSSDPSSKTKRFDKDSELQAKQIKHKLADVKKLIMMLFFPGGHGPLWDLATDASSSALIEAFISNTFCILCHVEKRKSKWGILVKGKKKPDFQIQKKKRWD
jgi:hypothetical protein